MNHRSRVELLTTLNALLDEVSTLGGSVGSVAEEVQPALQEMIRLMTVETAPLVGNSGIKLLNKIITIPEDITRLNDGRELLSRSWSPTTNMDEVVNVTCNFIIHCPIDWGND